MQVRTQDQNQQQELKDKRPKSKQRSTLQTAAKPAYGTCGHLAKSPYHTCGCDQYYW